MFDGALEAQSRMPDAIFPYFWIAEFPHPKKLEKLQNGGFSKDFPTATSPDERLGHNIFMC